MVAPLRKTDDRAGESKDAVLIETVEVLPANEAASATPNGENLQALEGRNTAPTGGQTSTLDSAAPGLVEHSTNLPAVHDPAPPSLTSDYKILFSQKLEHLVGKVSSNTQYYAQLSRLVLLVRKLDRENISPATYQQAYLAATVVEKHLDSNSTADRNVAQIIDDLEYMNSIYSPIFIVIKGLIYSVICVAAIMALLIFGSALTYHWATGQPFVGVFLNVVDSFLGNHIFVSALFGLFGSIVSILLRASEFEGSPRSKQFLLTTGGILPIVGVLFACVASAIFSSGMISFQFAGGSAEQLSPDFFVVLGFLAGFSERFMRGLLGQVEDRVNAPAQPNDAPDEKANGEAKDLVTAKAT